MKTQVRLPVVLAIVLLVVAGCASTPREPAEQLGMAKAALDAAEAEGAEQYASDDYTRAANKADQAERAIDARNFERGDRLAQQAVADATLAAANTRLAKTQALIAEIEDSIDVLRDELDAMQ